MDLSTMRYMIGKILQGEETEATRRVRCRLQRGIDYSGLVDDARQCIEAQDNPVPSTAMLLRACVSSLELADPELAAILALHPIDQVDFDYLACAVLADALKE